MMGVVTVAIASREIRRIDDVTRPSFNFRKAKWASFYGLMGVTMGFIVPGCCNGWCFAN